MKKTYRIRTRNAASGVFLSEAAGNLSAQKMFPSSAETSNMTDAEEDKKSEQGWEVA